MTDGITVSAGTNIKGVELNSFKAWMVCLSVSLFFFYDFIQMMMCNSLSEELMHEFSLSASGLSQLGSSFALSNVLFLFPAGLILDRVSTRKVTLVMLTLSIVGALGLASTESFQLAQMFRFIAGVAHAFCFLCCMSLATRWFSADKQAFIIGLIITIAMIGGLVAQTPLSLLTDSVGWRNALYINVGFGIGFLVMGYCVVEDYPAEMIESNKLNQQQLSEMGFWSSLVKAVSNVQNWMFGIFTGLLNLPIMLFGAIWGVSYLTQVFQLSKIDASLVTSMIFVGTLIGSPLAGKLSDRIDRRKLPMIIGGILSFITIVAIMYGPQWSFTSLAFLFFALGLFTSAQVISYPAINESNSQAISSTSMGLAAVLIMGLGGLSIHVSGWMLDLKWDGAMLNNLPVYNMDTYLFALGMIPIGFIVALLATLFMKETYCKARD